MQPPQPPVVILFHEVQVTVSRAKGTHRNGGSEKTNKNGLEDGLATSLGSERSSSWAFDQESRPSRPPVKTAIWLCPLPSPSMLPGPERASTPAIGPIACEGTACSAPRVGVNTASQLVWKMPRKRQRQHLDVHLGPCQPLPTSAVQTQGQGLVTSPTQNWWHVFGKHI